MSRPQPNITSLYQREQLFETILQALEKTGIAKDRVTIKDLAGVDEFHVRGLEATQQLAAKAGLQPGMQVLDIGCGIGGAARWLAAEYGCHVTGIDATPEYIRTAAQLSQLTGMQSQTDFICANALRLPFDNNRFDIVWTQHVQMNIADKMSFYSEMARVLRVNGRFVYYDVLAKQNRPIPYPLPWAADASTNFLTGSTDLHNMLLQAGLRPVQITDETEQGMEFLHRLLARISKLGLPNLGIQLLLGEKATEKMQNLYTALQQGSMLLESGIYQRLTTI